MKRITASALIGMLALSGCDKKTEKSEMEIARENLMSGKLYHEARQPLDRRVHYPGGGIRRTSQYGTVMALTYADKMKEKGRTDYTLGDALIKMDINKDMIITFTEIQDFRQKNKL